MTKSAQTATLYFGVPLYSIPISEYTIPIVGQALSVHTAVPQVAITAQAKARTCAELIPGTESMAGTKLEHTTTPATVLEQKFVVLLKM